MPGTGANYPYPYKIDLSNCEDEPIHIIQIIQDQACLIACSPKTLEILQVSENISRITAIPVPDLSGKHLQVLLDEETINLIRDTMEKPESLRGINPIRVSFFQNDNLLWQNLIAHIHQDILILELEPIDEKIGSSEFQYQLSQSISKIQSISALPDLFDTAALEIKQLTGYDRVMVYRFDSDYNGEVIAEAREAHLEPFLGLHYPASDIPRQARDLFLKNQVRLIENIHAGSSRIIPSLNPKTQQALDLTYSVSRGVSPIHVEYLNNMGVCATLNISIAHNDRLWGLFACHHYAPKFVDFTLRTTCRFIGQIFSGHLALQAANDFRQSVLQVNIARSHLFEQISKDWNVIEGLTKGPYTLLDMADCGGAAISIEGEMTLIGKTPNKNQVMDIVNWLEGQERKAVFHTNALPKIYPDAHEFKDTATGLMAINITPEELHYVLWFKPEVLKTVHWGGNPEKAVLKSEDGMRLTPRKSFEKWSQKVENTATPWAKYEIEAALALRHDIKDFIVQKYHEVRQMNKELVDAYEDLESFSYSVSHDLRAPLRSIDGFAQILMEDYADKLDHYGQHVVKTIIGSAAKMNDFINDILEFSKLSKEELMINELDMNLILAEMIEKLAGYEKDRKIQFKIQENLPSVWGDQSMITHVIENLLSNAIKYTRREKEAIIEITGKKENNFTQISISDNGIGFDMKYVNKIFGVFTRGVNDDEFEGTGVGLAIVKRVVDKHGGKISVKSKPQKGSTFIVEFPISSHSK